MLNKKSISVLLVLSLSVLMHLILGNVYVEKGNDLIPIACDKADMYIVERNGKRMCRCIANFYLDINNKLDINTTASCAHCTDCSYVPGRNYTALACGTYSNTKCCSHPFEAAFMGEKGHLQCLDLEANPSVISQCWRSHMSRRTREDGKEICACDVGFYLEKGYPLKCKKCTECKSLESRQHTAQDCGKYQDTVCCSDSTMTAIPTEYGGSECRHPDPPVPTLAGVTTKPPVISDRDEVKRRNSSTTREICICGDHSSHGKCDCKFTSHRRSEDSEDGTSHKYPKGIIYFMIATMILVLFLGLYFTYRKERRNSGVRNNLDDIEALKSKNVDKEETLL